MERKLLLFMPTMNQTPEKLIKKIVDISDLSALLEKRRIKLHVLAVSDGTKAELRTPEILEKMKKELGPIFDFFSHKQNMGKTATVIEGLSILLKKAKKSDLLGCLDDNEHSFLSALDLIEKIDEGYLGAIGTISYPSDILNHIDRHAMPAVGAVESEIMGIKGTLCIYASGYWIQYAEIVRKALEVYPLYEKKFREMFPNEIIKVPKWGTPTLLQEFMTWVIRTQEPWIQTEFECRRLAACYLPCKEVPALTPLGRSTEKALNQMRALILNGLVLDEILGPGRDKQDINKKER